MGLSLDLDKFDVSAALANRDAILATESEQFTVNEWSLITLGTSAIKGYLSALVTMGAELNVIVQPWTE